MAREIYDENPDFISSPINITTKRTPWRTTTAPAQKSGARPRPRHALSGDYRHHRHADGHGPLSQRAKPGHSHRRRRTRQRIARHRRFETHGIVDYAGHLSRRKFTTKRFPRAPKTPTICRHRLAAKKAFSSAFPPAPRSCFAATGEQLEASGAYSEDNKAIVVTILCDRGDRYLTQLGRMHL